MIDSSVAVSKSDSNDLYGIALDERIPNIQAVQNLNQIYMFNKFTITDKFLFIAAFLSLIFSEILYFKGESNAAIFIGIWVPSILAFGIYLKLINNRKDD